jgi:hypothetical protein
MRIIEAKHGVIIEEQEGVEVLVVIVGVVNGGGAVDAVKERRSSSVALIGKEAVFVERQSRIMFEGLKTKD